MVGRSSRAAGGRACPRPRGPGGQDRYEEADRVALEPDEPPSNASWSRFASTSGTIYAAVPASAGAGGG